MSDLEEKKQRYQTEVRNWSVSNLKNNPEFMQLSRENEEFREWVLDQRPDMAISREPKIKFKRPEGLEPVSDEIQPVELKQLEPVEGPPKAVQLYRDVVAYGKKKGFL